MNYSQKIKNFSEEVEADFQAAINKAAILKNKKFQMIIGNFVRNLNDRYKRHCFIFNDTMGMKSLDCYHRVSGERICWWSQDSCYEGESSMSIWSATYDLRDSELSKEIIEVMNTLCSEFEGKVEAGFYFQWEGKTSFDYVEDKL